MTRRQEPAAAVRGVAGVLVLALPVLVAIWSLPFFVTQDGPAHLYTAHLLARLIGGDSWLESYVHVQRFPLPNFLAQLLLAGPTALFSGRVADQIMMSITFAGLAASIVWLRYVVRASRGLLLVVPFALIIALGRLWLLGFYGFLIGALLFCLILAWWWRTNTRTSARWSAILALLLVLAWFAHLVSYGATVIALGIFTIGTPGRSTRRVICTAVAAIPSLVFAAWYFGVMAARGSFSPHYLRLENHSFLEWLQYLRSVKLLSIARHTTFPFVQSDSPMFVILAPAVLTAVAFIIWTIATGREHREERDDVRTGGSWAIITILFLSAGLVAPDSFGAQHGGFLRERLFLLGLISAVPAWSFKPSQWNRVASFLVLAAFALQSAFVWEYARRSNEQIRSLMAVAGSITDRSRVFVIRPRRKDEFRASPTLHAANLLGLNRRVVVWNNYQANLYYFPVNFNRLFLPCSDDGECELRENWQRIDLVVTWDSQPNASNVPLPWFPRRVTAAPGLSVFARAEGVNVDSAWSR